MNPITVKGPKGTYVVVVSHCGTYYRVTSADGKRTVVRDVLRVEGDRVWRQGAGIFSSLAMALYVAAEQAGAQRQRVEVVRGRYMVTPELPPEVKRPEGWDGSGYLIPLAAWHDAALQQEVGTAAHVYARARYAAAGVTA